MLSYKKGHEDILKLLLVQPDVDVNLKNVSGAVYKWPQRACGLCARICFNCHMPSCSEKHGLCERV